MQPFLASYVARNKRSSYEVNFWVILIEIKKILDGSNQGGNDLFSKIKLFQSINHFHYDVMLRLEQFWRLLCNKIPILDMHSSTSGRNHDFSCKTYIAFDREVHESHSAPLEVVSYLKATVLLVEVFEEKCPSFARDVRSSSCKVSRQHSFDSIKVFNAIWLTWTHKF